MANERFLGKVQQGEDESIVYTVTTTLWGASPTSVAVVATLDGTVVTATVLSGAASVSGNVITLPAVASLTADNQYRIEVKFTSGGSTFEGYFLIDAEV